MCLFNNNKDWLIGYIKMEPSTSDCHRERFPQRKRELLSRVNDKKYEYMSISTSSVISCFLEGIHIATCIWFSTSRHAVYAHIDAQSCRSWIYHKLFYLLVFKLDVATLLWIAKIYWRAAKNFFGETS